jgi:hypothetical protein
MTPSLARTLAAALVGLGLLQAAAPASAQQGASGTEAGARGAAAHFRRGVSLYKDGDYGGALVEFRRAYDSSPNYRVLYDIGQALYQLQRYAEALTAFEAYLTQGGSQIGAARRASVEGDLKTLHARVGHVAITVDEPGADVLVDDHSVGTSPLAEPVLVSVGHRKIAASKAGRPPVMRFVDIAAGDMVKVSLEVAEPPPPPPVVTTVPAPPPPVTTVARTGTADTGPSEADRAKAGGSRGYLWIPWTLTAAFAAGTAVTGGLALAAQSSFNSQLGSFPGNASAIASDRSRANSYALASDVLLAATAVSLGVSLYVTFAPSHPSSARLEPRQRLVLGPTGFAFAGEY